MVESEALDFWELSRDAAGRIIAELGFDDEKRTCFAITTAG